MEPAHAFEPVSDWAPPPAPARPPARLYLPGNECMFQTVVVAPEPEAPAGNGGGDAGGESGGVGDVAQQEDEAPPPAAPPAEEQPGGEGPVEDEAPAPPPTRTVQIESGTTIPPDILDPYHPLPQAPMNVSVGPCR